MTLPVFWAPDAVAVVGATARLEGDEARHAAVVRRIRPGEQVVLTDGAGTAAVCEVTTAARTVLEATVLSVSHAERHPLQLTVVQAIPKGDRGELAVEVLTEVGVDRIVPWSAARSVAVWRGERAQKSLARWRSTAREAAKQSRRWWFPEVADPAGTPTVTDLLASVDLAVVLHEDAQTSLGSLAMPEAGSVVVVVGPEGGIAPEELEAFTGAAVVRIGPTVLRTSTAGVAAAAALLSRTSRW
ncbi:16S rRNA (uracil(1498)-N(3))-methyltransferase [Nocardioides terrisoli]|uniref:16S rRNA (uracil(1498)-N(3))-methyltransferase n=1 Tax=Nocardioides terrisoli TaxID=3388267 RepID=UPI00287B788B|nr:16S rRNA (uracil(1498)-N(3))-methyltransferase [Nocardioides marmorisolisilvae]